MQTLSLPIMRIHRIAVSAIFFLYGLCFASWGSRIPEIQHKLGLSEPQLGLVLLALPCGLMLSLPISGWLTTRLGSRKVVIVTAVVHSMVLVTVGLAGQTSHLVAALFMFGLTGNMVNISANTQAVGVEKMYGRTIMASFHGLWSLAGFAGGSIGSFMIGRGFVPYQHFIFIMSVALLIVILTANHLLPKDASNAEGQPIFALPDKSLLILGLIAFCCMICEGAMFDWSGVYFRKVVGAEGAWQAAGFTAFMSTMAFGRFIADWLTTRFGKYRILQFSGVLTASGLLIAVLFPNLITALIGFLLVGLGVSSVVPLVYSEAGRSTKLSPGMALAAVSTIGFLGFLIGPVLIGLVAGATSLRISFTIIAVMGLSIALFATVRERQGVS
jgi:MFS family permease